MKDAGLSINSYQLDKAKKIVAFLLDCRSQSTLTRLELAKVVSIMSGENWRTVCLQAGVPVAELPAKAAVLKLLRGRAIHVSQ